MSDFLRILPGGYYPRITPSDDDSLQWNGRFPSAVSVGVAGVLVVEDLYGNEQTFTATELAAGTIYPIACAKIKSTSTTADEIRVYYY